MIGELALGLLLSSVVAGLAYQQHALSRSGLVGGVLVGTAIFVGGGWGWALILITFFVSSSLLSRYRESGKANLAEKFSKGHRRDLGQVIANGGVAALLALAYRFQPQPVLLAAFLGAMATVNADTWATELGVLSRQPPRLITNGRQVAVGTSGAISLAGGVAALLGAALIGLTAGILQGIAGANWESALMLLLVVVPAGLAGSLVDSLLGATLQGMYYCPRCQQETERRQHRCGTITTLKRGWPGLDNDWVNLLSALAGAILAGGLLVLFQ